MRTKITNEDQKVSIVTTFHTIHHSQNCDPKTADNSKFVEPNHCFLNFLISRAVQFK